jgi:hypothetical protein
MVPVPFLDFFASRLEPDIHSGEVRPEELGEELPSSSDLNNIILKQDKDIKM